MGVLTDLTNDRERRTLVRLGLAATLALVAVLVVVARTRTGLSHWRLESARLQESADRTERALEKARSEWQRWQEAAADLEDLRNGTFYGPEDGVQALRLDLQGIFALAGAPVPDIAYNYAELDKERVRKTQVTFTYNGSYAGLKRLLAALEAFPRFLIIERIEFPRTETSGDGLSAKLTLGAYYAF